MRRHEDSATGSFSHVAGWHGTLARWLSMVKNHAEGMLLVPQRRFLKWLWNYLYKRTQRVRSN